MAVSAQLQLGRMINPIFVYDVISLDYTIYRNHDATVRPCSGVLGGVLKVTIRGKKEMTTPFHTWINENKLDNGRILIYDSTSTIGSMVGTVTKSEVVPDVDKLIDAGINAIERGGNSKLGNIEAEEDQFDDMNRKELKAYIKDKKYDIKVDTGDTDEDIRNKIRLKESGKADDWSDLTKKSLLDNIKKDRVNTAKGIVKATAKWILESARTIEFKDAFCVSVREIFSNSGDSPWQIQIDLLCPTLEISGSGVAGQTLLNQCKVKF